MKTICDKCEVHKCETTEGKTEQERMKCFTEDIAQKIAEAQCSLKSALEDVETLVKVYEK